MNRVATVVLVLATAIASIFTASADGLTLTLGAEAQVGQPYAIAAEGAADEASVLYVYVDPGGEECRAAPNEEAGLPTVSTLSAGGGESVGPGSFTRPYSYTPPARDGYSVCAYMQEPIWAVMSASAGFAAPGGPSQAPYLFDPKVEEESKRRAVEYEEQSERERMKQQSEREELERIPASEFPQPDPSVRQTVPVAHPLPVVHCVVPALSKRSLRAARADLHKAHCALGTVVRPRDAGGRLVVIRQSARRGTRLRSGVSVNVVLGRAT